MRNEVKRTAYVKEGRNWRITYECTDRGLVYQSLTEDLIAKKLNACTYIKSIKRYNNWDGTQTVTVDYCYGENKAVTHRNVYIVKN